MIVVVLVVHVIVGVGGGVGFDCLVIHPRLGHLRSRKILTLHRSLPSLALSSGKNRGEGQATVDWCDMRTSTSSKFDKDQEPAP